jgi:hypothetical protein
LSGDFSCNGRATDTKKPSQAALFAETLKVKAFPHDSSQGFLSGDQALHDYLTQPGSFRNNRLGDFAGIARF